MRFALVNNQKLEPQPKLRGACPHCGDEMISKCGRTKVWHWAHKSREICDPWWENETKWHREWKNEFPAEWQEISHVDPINGEKHIADVKAASGLVVEIQNSPMSFKEMISRENFYGNMIWIVNGLRGGLDLSYFQMGLGRQPIQNNPLAYSVKWWGRSRILHNWSFANVRVFLDFGDSLTKGPPVLWRLVNYDRQKKLGAVGPYPKHLLIEAITRGNEIGMTYLPEHGRENARVPDLQKKQFEDGNKDL